MLTELDRANIRHHLGYLAVGATNNNSQAFPPPGAPGNAASVQFGIPRPVETLFLLELAMNQILEISIPRVRDMLGTLDLIERTMVQSIVRLAADKVGSITLRSSLPGQSEQDALEREYQRWAARLADDLGVPFYPFSRRFKAGTGYSGSVRNLRIRS